jgi:hypothetical protein
LLLFFLKKINKLKFTSLLCIFVVSVIFIFKPLHKEKVDDFVNVVIDSYTTSYKNTFLDKSDKKISSDMINLLLIKNLSLSVYFFNFKIALHYLFDRPFGWGLFNYQFAHNKYSKITKSYIEGSSWLNNSDGSNILFKSKVKLGIFSLLLWGPFMFFLFNKKIDFHYKLLIAPPIITQVLIRGSGFFNGGIIVFIILYFYLLFKKN